MDRATLLARHVNGVSDSIGHRRNVDRIITGLLHGLATVARGQLSELGFEARVLRSQRLNLSYQYRTAK
jgi:hypothetical protein